MQGLHVKFYTHRGLFMESVTTNGFRLKGEIVSHGHTDTASVIWICVGNSSGFVGAWFQAVMAAMAPLALQRAHSELVLPSKQTTGVHRAA